MNETYPIKIKCSAEFLSEFQACEEGAYQDAQREAREGGELPNQYRPLKTHAYVVARRWKTQLEIRNAEEADEVYYALCSGTIGLYHCKQANRVADVLRPYARPETVKRWPYQNGY